MPRVKGIFPPSATSLSPIPRQWGSRYAIRAGRNLPDKEFRYLRTVIVTAAVYRGFGSSFVLRLTLPLTFRHRAGIRPYTSSSDLAESCVFGKQSLPPFLCNQRPLRARGSDGRRPTFSRSYGRILPSSLGWVLSSALEYSSRPPESVYGTDTTGVNSVGAFLGSLGSLSSWAHSALLMTSRSSVFAFVPIGSNENLLQV